MSGPPAAMTQRERIVAALSARISAGALRAGERLDSESGIAAEFGVSRGTVRGALAELQRRDLIATRAGLGSFVTFDGSPLDPDVGWARALTDAGAAVTTEILGITLVPAASATPPPGPAHPTAAPAHAVPPELAGRDVVVLARRRLLDGRPISYERAVVPATGPLRDLPTTGLVDDSLTATLRSAGLVAHHGTQDARVVPTSGDVAAHLEHAPGTVVLRTTRLSYSADGSVVEHVESFLDPAHFSLHLTFGDTPA
ncbi:GntR family transcriptional regulator [Georgenia sp. Z1491]|uniref:GntR family transcriptional regulator n=1 Tax=Georgenia sp. Z1491 TaxID=3416707 RepID=UPI003CFB911B